MDGLQTTGKVKLSMKFTSLTHNQNGSIYDDSNSMNESATLPPLAPHGAYFPVPQSHVMQHPHTTSSQGNNYGNYYNGGNNSVVYDGSVAAGGSIVSGGVGIASGGRYSTPAVYNNVQNSPEHPPRKVPSGQQQQGQQNGFMAAPIQSSLLDASVHISPMDEFKLKLVSISAIDLLPVHNFAANSPVANIACGKFSGATEVGCDMIAIEIPSSLLCRLGM